MGQALVGFELGNSFTLIKVSFDSLNTSTLSCAHSFKDLKRIFNMQTRGISVARCGPIYFSARRFIFPKSPRTCLLCKAQSTLSSLQRQHSPLLSANKPYYVTTPIFYVNAAPHVGHLHSMVLADVLKRWQRLMTPNRDVSSTLHPEPTPYPMSLLSTGTDEHGLKVQQAAERAGVSPQSLCDTNSDRFRALAAAAGVEYDFFARTTAPEHRSAVQHFWRQLVKSGLVYKDSRSGWYSVGDECFYKNAEVSRMVEPRTGRLGYASTVTGSEVTWVDEENYHFRLTAFKDKLLELYGVATGNTIGKGMHATADVLPRERRNEVISWIKTSLSDLSISRPSSRLNWGIPVPDDPSQTIYVWVDALVNYIVQAGYPDAPNFPRAVSKSNDITGLSEPSFETPSQQSDEQTQALPPSPWPADVHIIGKDILRFHCIYWPAFLMAVGLPQPRLFLTHAHWKMDNRKMSKSLGNVVDPMKQLERWGRDPLRYFLMAEAGAMADDRNYSNDRVMMRYKELMSKVGNVFNRVRKFDLATAVQLGSASKWPTKDDDDRSEIHELLNELPSKFEREMNQYQIPLAISHVINVMETVSHDVFT